MHWCNAFFAFDSGNFSANWKNQKAAYTPENFFRAVQAAKHLYLDDVFLWYPMRFSAFWIRFMREEANKG